MAGSAVATPQPTRGDDMTVLIGSSFAGLEADTLAIEEPIRAADVRIIMQDQAHAWERTTGLAADQAGSTTSSTNAAHRHNHSTSTEGTLLYRQFASWQYGTKGPNGTVAAENAALSTYAAPLTITETSSTSDTENVGLAGALIYVPSGWADRDLLFLLDCSGDPDIRLTLRDSGGTAVTGYENITLQPAAGLTSQMAVLMAATAPVFGSAWCAVVQAPSAGVYWLDARTNLRQNDGSRTRVIYGGTVVGVCDVSRGVVLGRGAWAQTYSGTSVQVGDPDASNAWQPIDDVWCPSGGDSPLHVGLVQKLNENAALTWEKATGLPAPGNAALTITRGHTHSGASGEGPEIGVGHVACVFGGQSNVTASEFTGNRSTAPNSSTTSQRVTAIGATYMPRSTNTSAGASKVKSAVLVYVETSKGNTLRTVLSFGSTSLTFDSTTGGAGYEVLTTPTAGSNAYAFTENASNAWVVEQKLSVSGGAGGAARVLAVLWYTEEA